MMIEQRIALERIRQEAKAERGEFAWTCSDPAVTHPQRLAVLVEEVGEVARAVLGLDGAVNDGGNLEQELIQVAAVTVAWLEAMGK